jgi:ubiquitin-conjugating enzyme E2 S
MSDAPAPATLRKLMKEMKSLTNSPPEGVRVEFSTDNITNITAEIDGPESTPFEGGLFRLKLVLGKDYPRVPPKGFFTTKIFHPNVSNVGEICVNTLKRDWSPELGIRHVLIVIRCLLIHPNPASALNEAAGKMLLDDYDAFANRAKLMTQIHAVARSDENDAKNAQGVAATPGSSSSGTKSKPKTVAAKKIAKANKKKTAAKKKNLRRL